MKYLVPFLVSGKLATMPFTTELSFASVKEMSAGEPFQNQTSVNRLEDIAYTKAGVTTDRRGGRSEEDRKGSLKMDLLISGARAGDEVVVGVSEGKDDPNLVEVNPRLHLDLHKLTVLSHFTVVDTADINKPSFYDEGLSSREPHRVVSIPIDFGGMYRQIVADNLYLQVVVAPKSEWNWHDVRCSDLAQIKFRNNSVVLLSANVTEDCTRFRCY